MPRVAADQREALAQSRRDQIVSAAVRRWLADGFDATTVSAIAREAGIAKGTLYIYFRTKQDILDEAIRRYSLVPDLRGFLGQIAARPAEETIPVLVRGLWQGLRARVDVVQLFMRELAVRPEHARRFLETVVIPVNELVGEHFQAEIDSGGLRDVDMFIASRALVGMLMAFLVTQDMFGGRQLHPMSDDEITGAIADLFLYGVVARGGS